MEIKTDNSSSSFKLLIIRDSRICGGDPIIMGTRMRVKDIRQLYYKLKWTIDRIKSEYPFLTEEQIKVCLEEV